MNVISRENYRRPKNSWRSQKNSVWKLSGKINFCIFSDPFLTTVHNLKCLLFPFWSLRAEIFIKEYILSLCQINVAKSTCILFDPFMNTAQPKTTYFWCYRTKKFTRGSLLTLFENKWSNQLLHIFCPAFDHCAQPKMLTVPFLLTSVVRIYLDS